MRRKYIFTRSKLSSPPDDTQREWLYDQIYKSISSERLGTPKKVVVKYNENIYALQEDDEQRGLVFLPDNA